MTVTVLGDAHGIKLLMRVPLRTADSHFELYKVIALPTKLSDNKFIRYQVDFPYFAVGHNQQDYVLFSDMDKPLCTEGLLTVCSANTAIYNAQIKSCVSSLYFQDTDSYNMCNNSLLVSYSRPVLHHYGTTWLYHFPNPQLVTMRCWENNAWATSTLTLVGNGIITNTTRCSISTNTFRTFPVLLGRMQATAATGQLYIPDKVPEAADPELQALEETKPSGVTSLDDVITRMKTRPKLVDVDTLLHVHQLASQQKQHTNWYMISTITLCAVILIGILSSFLQGYACSFLQNCISKNTVPTPNALDQENPTFPIPSPKPTPREARSEDSERSIAFAMYSRQQAD